MENDAFRMQNGGRKVAISGAPIDAQGCGLSSVLSTELFPAGGHTAGNHLLPSSSICLRPCGVSAVSQARLWLMFVRPAADSAFKLRFDIASGRSRYMAVASRQSIWSPRRPIFGSAYGSLRSVHPLPRKWRGDPPSRFVAPTFSCLRRGKTA